MSGVIRSRDNALVKRLARLAAQGKARREEGVAVAEGWHLVRAIHEAPAYGPAAIEAIAISESALDHPEALAMRGRLEGVPFHVIDARVFGRLAAEEGPNAVVALFRLPASAPVGGVAGFALWLDAVQDPGNVGTLIRTAAAAGAGSVALGTGCADPWSPKTLRAGMGGQFLLDIATDADLPAIARHPGRRLAALAADGPRSVYDADLSGDLVLVLGNEGAGIGAELLALVSERLAIPMAPGIESLNVAAAGAIVCFERVRQMRVGHRSRA